MPFRLLTPLIALLLAVGMVPVGGKGGILVPGVAAAGELDLIGYTRLKDQLGDRLPTGVGITVAQIEVSQSAAPLKYVPTTDGDSEAEFAGKTFDLASGASGDSSHATRVGGRFYGNSQSVAPGVSTIINYIAVDPAADSGGWLNDDFLRVNSGSLPKVTPARVFNHSWVNNDPSANLDALHRIDYLVETDDIINVIGIANDPDPVFPMFASAFNSIAVGVTRGTHTPGAASFLSAPYTSGRMRPHLVAPTSVTSFATPLVSGTAAMLLETAQSRPWLSNGTILSSIGRNDWTLQQGETSEVIRSLLMAGADREANFGGNGIRQTYQVDTDSGLDSLYGAGELDVFNSYQILAAGEQDSLEMGGSGDIKLYGFDYDPAISANSTRSYRFSIDSVERDFAASLNWNLAVDMNFNGVRFDGTPETSFLRKVANLNLKLVNITGGASETVSQSNGTGDTTENLYVAELGAGDYEIQVSFLPSTPVGSIDYGLAWRFSPSLDPLAGDVNLDGQVSLLDVAIIQANMGQTERVVWTDGDTDGDGLVDRSDLRSVLSQLGSVALPTAAVVASPVPEPSSLVLVVLGVFWASISRRRRVARNHSRG